VPKETRVASEVRPDASPHDEKRNAHAEMTDSDRDGPSFSIGALQIADGRRPLVWKPATYHLKRCFQERNRMNLAPEITSRTITMMGGLVAAGAAVIAEFSSTDSPVGTGSFLLGSAGLIAAISAFTKDYWTDRQKQREHEVALLRIKLQSCRTSCGIVELYNWARAAHASVAGLPAVPELHLDSDIETETEKHDT
jgi:hypothetical protein